ncbi:MAG: DUF2723 domain-containing protein [Chloroflexota bacterium]
METRPSLISPNFMLVILICVTGALYLFTLDTGLHPQELTGGDLITHQYAQVEARFSNAPGYPLYTMLGWLWFRLGRNILGWILDPIQVLSLYSTFWGVASLAVLFRILYRPNLSGQRVIFSLLLSLFYATTYFFWYYSVTTEQYTSAILQTLVLIYLAFEWEHRPKNRTLWLMAFVSGTMAANMLTTLFILPPLLYLIFSKRPAILKDIKLIVQTTAIGLLPLLSYTYVFIRGAQHPEWRGAGNWTSTAEWFIQFVSTQQGRDELAPGLTLQNLITPEFPALIWQELTWVVFLGGLIGLTLMGRRMTIFFYGTLVIYACFVTAYRFGNWFQVILPAYPMFVIGFGRLMAAVSDRFKGKGAVNIGLYLLLVMLVFYRFSISLPRADQSHLTTDTGLEPGWRIVEDIAEPFWPVSVTFEEWVALQYLSTVWRIKPTIDLVEPGQSARYISRQAAETWPYLIDLSTAYPQAIGLELIYLSPQIVDVASAPQDVVMLNHSFADQMRLVGYKISNSQQQIMLFWTPLTTMETNYTISVRLWQFGQPIQRENGPLQQDHQPVWNTYPTSQWSVSELIQDAYTFELPPNTYAEQMHVVIYQQTETGFENLGDLLIDLR